MRKIFTIMTAVSLIGIAGNAAAVDGDFELFGHVNTAIGYQHFGSNAAATTTGAVGLANPVTTGTAGSVRHGPLGRLTTNNGAGVRQEQLIAAVDEVELNVTKSWGEHVRTRADIAFGLPGAGSGGVGLEQAYATLNIPAGNGIEFLLGRFTAPIGFESVERNDNSLWSHSLIFNYLRPTNYTGVKFYYPFSDMVDLNVYVVNNLRDSLTVDSAMPSFGLRLGFNWGDEGRKSKFGITGAAGPESLDPGNKVDNWSYLTDLDWNVWLSDRFALGGEAIFRTDRRALAAGADARYFAGLVNLMYQFNDTVDGTLRYAYGHAKGGSSDGLTSGAAGAVAGNLLNATGALAGSKTQLHEISAGLQYHIADGAKLQLEGRYDLVNVAGAAKGHVFGGVMGLLYNF